jgi:hypothetical protein
MMCVVGIGQFRSNNKRYGWLRRKFVENHPCKTDVVKKKISSSLKEYYRKNPKSKRIGICLFCEKEFVIYFREIFCSTKCFGKYRTENHKVSEQTKTKQSNSLKKYLSKLSQKQRKARMSAALKKCEENRNEIIEKIKLTKKKESEKIINMSDDKFEVFIRRMKLKKTNGGRNGNVVRYLTYRNIDVDFYYENNTLRSL